MIKNLIKNETNGEIIYEFDIEGHGLWDNKYRIVVIGEGDTYKKYMFSYAGTVDEEDMTGDPEDDIIWFPEPDGIIYEDGKLEYGSIFPNPVIIDLIIDGLFTEKEITDAQEYMKETGCRSYDMEWYLYHTDTIKEDYECHFVCTFKWLGKVYHSEFTGHDIMIYDEKNDIVYINKDIVIALNTKKDQFIKELVHFVETR